MKAFANVLKKNFLSILICPWQGTINVENATVDKSYVSFLPNGKYRFNGFTKYFMKNGTYDSMNYTVFIEST